MSLPSVSLDDKYRLEDGRVYLTGIQALVRLALMQSRRDRAAGLHTAGFISGYRGSPLGGLDRELWRSEGHLADAEIHFQPGLNEELAATAVWGSQQTGLFPGARYDGVFALWYGKGPGVDRCGDVFKHGNHAGSAAHGGVLLIAGDDHASKSSTLPHQSEQAFIAASIPVLAPATVQELIDFGLCGWALSRHSGCWIGMIVVGELADGSASVAVGRERGRLVTPASIRPGSLNIRWPDPPMQQEARLLDEKLPAVHEFARLNGLDRVVMDSPGARLGLVAAGKSYSDLRQALEELGIDAAAAARLGLRVYKPGLTWPLEPDAARRFAAGLEEILVIEEKRPVIEDQLRAILYDRRDGATPLIIGKRREDGSPLLHAAGELSAAEIACAVAGRILRLAPDHGIEERRARIERALCVTNGGHGLLARVPWFCSGCPHNTSTRVPEGSRAVAGIGCHYMASWMPDRNTATFTQMGGEGATWIGQAPFTETPHVFANLGDGTYDHSGILAIRAAVAAKVDITYKLLFNGVVAMTGGQPLDGGPTVPAIVRQLAAEGVSRIAVVTDDPGRYRGGALPRDVAVHHRDALDGVQRELRAVPGVTVLVYDQACAAENRRRRHHGQIPDPPKRAFINEAVCEGCGDCATASHCLSVVPVETEFGRKRAIDQSSCNKDFSCLRGFCPSFVTVHGGRLRGSAETLDDALIGHLPEPELPALDRPYAILVAGVGGTGVVTAGALIGMAAHLDGRGVAGLDMTGLAQKGGAVTSHLRIFADPDGVHAARIGAGEADLVIGCDELVAAAPDTRAVIRAGMTRLVVNLAETITGAFLDDPDLQFPRDGVRDVLTEAAGADAVDFIDAKRCVTALERQAAAVNLFLLGYAWQRGFLPVSEAALEQAVTLNGTDVADNLRAFRWGRAAAHDPGRIQAILLRDDAEADPDHVASPDLDTLIARRAAALTAFQNRAYAERYRSIVERIRRVEAERAPGRHGLAEAVARSLHRLMAYKDEYEVARLYTDGAFRRRLAARFEGDYRLEFHLAPPILARRDAVTGHLRKQRFGPWMMGVFHILARLRFLRGTALDPFGRTEERRMERRLIGDYERLLDEIAALLRPDNHALAVTLAEVAGRIRGFGHVKQASLVAAKRQEEELLNRLREPAVAAIAAD